MRRRTGRRGYAMMLVLLFVVLYLSLLGVAWRRVASAVRIASVRTVQAQRDEGSLHALARAMHLLETGLPSTSPYVCGVTITTSTEESYSYTVTFTEEEDETWSVHCARTQTGEDPAPMPDDFAPARS